MPKFSSSSSGKRPSHCKFGPPPQLVRQNAISFQFNPHVQHMIRQFAVTQVQNIEIEQLFQTPNDDEIVETTMEEAKEKVLDEIKNESENEVVLQGTNKEKRLDFASCVRLVMAKERLSQLANKNNLNREKGTTKEENVEQP